MENECKFRPPMVKTRTRPRPAAVVAERGEVLAFIERYVLHGKGIGYVDVHSGVGGVDRRSDPLDA